jgi:hypothetical protein
VGATQTHHAQRLPRAQDEPVRLQRLSAIGALNFGWFVTSPSSFTLYNNGGADGTPATKGMVLGSGSGGGPWCVIDAAAGTYDIEAQYGVDGGTSAIRNRRLRVWTAGF